MLPAVVCEAPGSVCLRMRRFEAYTQRMRLTPASLILACLVCACGTSVSGGVEPGGTSAVQLQAPCGDCPYLYGANPAHPEISSQGLRDREYALPKPEGGTRILVLGDSVTFGTGVARSQTFPKQLERELRRGGKQVEVINAGVNGYTAYNEVQFYLGRMRALDPDVVVLAVVLNDAVNPRLHWGVFEESPLFEVPDAATPNVEDERTRLKQATRSQSAFNAHVKRSHEINKKGKADGKGRRWPVYLTGEDSIGIETLLDYDSAEWRWLRGLYGELKKGVEADGARLVLLVLPLAYQMEQGYPFDPQPLFERYCREASLDCVDPLPAFRAERGKRRLFIGTDAGYLDVWHLTHEGHGVVAAELERSLATPR